MPNTRLNCFQFVKKHTHTQTKLVLVCTKQHLLPAVASVGVSYEATSVVTAVAFVGVFVYFFICLFLGFTVFTALGGEKKR